MAEDAEGRYIGERYRINIDFDGGDTGEIIYLDPALAQDWIDAKFISLCDERGERIVGITIEEANAGGIPAGYVPPPEEQAPVDPSTLPPE